MVAKIDFDTLKILRTNKKQKRLKLGKKLRRASHNSKFTDSYKKRVNTKKTSKKEYYRSMHIILCSIVENSDNNLLFVFDDQTKYFKIGKFCSVISKLNVKWSVTQNGFSSPLLAASLRKFKS